jgi:hypothetical protein
MRLVRDELLASENLQQVTNNIIHLATNGETDAIIELLDKLIPGANVRNAPQPDITSIV